MDNNEEKRIAGNFVIIHTLIRTNKNTINNSML